MGSEEFGSAWDSTSLFCLLQETENSKQGWDQLSLPAVSHGQGMVVLSQCTQGMVFLFEVTQCPSLEDR